MATSTRWGAAIALLALAALGTTACNSSSSSATKIALLLPESKTARYESQDKPLFEAKVKELCGDCEILYSNADQDATKQQQQADAALTNGAKVLVLDPVDAASAAPLVTKAKRQNVPVIAYDRLIKGADIDAYISFDNEQVGKLQGQALVDKLKKDGKTSGKLVMINGAATDNNAGQFKKGAHSVIDASGFTVGQEYDTPDWSPDKAQGEMDQAITALGKDGFVGVYAANDGTAGGAVAAGIQRVLAGEQYMTVYKAVKPEAAAAATIAVSLARGKGVPADVAKTKVNNEQKDVPSAIFDPVAVTKDNVKDTVVKDGFWTAAQLCTGTYKDACTAAGIS
jgi:D-xylose transport system substrate-binding protein